MPFLHTATEKIYYEIHSPVFTDKTETVVMVHSCVTDHTLFDSITAELTQHYRVIHYDLRETGKSASATGELSFEAHIEDLFLLLHTLHIKKCYLVGVGFGGQIAVKFTARYEFLIEGLILLSLPFYSDSTIQKIKRCYNGESKNQIPVNKILELGKLERLEYTNIQEVIERLKQMDPNVYFRFVKLSITASLFQELSSISLPVLTLSGQHDLLFSSQYLISRTMFLKNYSHMTIPNTHSLFLIKEKTALFREIVIDFIKSNTSQLPSLKNDPMKILKNWESDTAIDIQKKFHAHTPSLKVDFLYSFSVCVNGQLITEGWNKRFAQEILLYLIFHHSISREQLCEALWPDIPLSNAKKNLRVYLSHLKKLLNAENSEPVLLVNRQLISLNADVSSDGLDLLTDLQWITEQSDPSLKFKEAEQRLHQLVPHYLTTIYDDWFLDIRVKIEIILLDLLIWMKEWLCENGKVSKAVFLLVKFIDLVEEKEFIYDEIIDCYIKLDNNEKSEYWLNQKMQYLVE
ncbi:alpha/beta fold hydrolase [Priestia aryabhattai]|uniref:alpha/beta fold hydrolase n=1 Tax=Priestia aryabhattai TaxID=412384 RepID=UPI002E207E64|nr:alpha/beta hydrolase [Priestia aryabhattai]